MTMQDAILEYIYALFLITLRKSIQLLAHNYSEPGYIL